MIGARSLNARLELQVHRSWLNSFLSRSQSYYRSPRAFYHAVLPKDHGQSRTPPRHPNSQTRIWTAHFATKRLKIRKTQPIDRKEHESSSVLQELRQAVQDEDIRKIAKLYQSISDKSVIKPRDFRTIAQRLHHALRDAKTSFKDEARAAAIMAMAVFAETLVKDLTEGKLAPQTEAHVHLLGFFKESDARDAGVEFWQWLEPQDARYANSAVYGAAIELLALNGTPLRELEELYVKALHMAQSSGQFSAYWLSPGAIIPDRDRPTNIPHVPMILFQGILTARLLHGDTKNAYMALDTILRLYPDQAPERVFRVFLEERPLLEAYPIFAVACRGGVSLSSGFFTQIISALRRTSDLVSPISHSIAIRAMLSALYLHLGAGGRVKANQLSELIITITQLLRLEGVLALTSKEKQRISLEVMELIRALFLVFARYGVRPSLTAFNSIITNLGGFGQSKEIVGIALADIEGLGLHPNEVTRRSILSAAGALRDADFVRQAWDDLVNGRTQSGQSPNTTDFYVLIKYATITGQREFAALEFEKWKEEILEEDRDGIKEALIAYTNERPSHQAIDPADISSIFTEIKKIGADLEVLRERTEGSPRLQDFRDEQLPMTFLQSASEVSLPEKEMRRLYDELTTEPGTSQGVFGESSPKSDLQPEPDPETIRRIQSRKPGQAVEISDVSEFESPMLPTASPTNIPFGTLRYENWKSINHLMEMAQKNDELYVRAVDAAIAAGIVPPRRSLGLLLESHRRVESYGLSDVASAERSAEQELERLDAVQVQERRNLILELRGRLS